MDIIGSLWDAILTAAGLFWRAFWALALGYAISAFIQVFLSRGEAAKYLGEANNANYYGWRFALYLARIDASLTAGPEGATFAIPVRLPIIVVKGR